MQHSHLHLFLLLLLLLSIFWPPLLLLLLLLLLQMPGWCCTGAVTMRGCDFGMTRRCGRRAVGRAGGGLWERPQRGRARRRARLRKCLSHSMRLGQEPSRLFYFMRFEGNGMDEIGK